MVTPSAAGGPAAAGPRPSGQAAARVTRRGFLDATPGPVLPAAAQTWQAALETGWSDPAARHSPGRRARQLLDTAREVLAQGLGARPDELTFHGSGDQAARAALSGLARARRRSAGRVVASAVEHSTLLRWLRAQETPPVEVPVDPTGRADLEAWCAAVSPETPFAVLQHANQEVGTRQPLARARDHAATHGVPLLVDARAGLGRDDASPGAVTGHADVLVADAATWGGPPLGVLVVRTGTRYAPWHPPSRHEGGLSLDPPDVPRALAAAEAWRQSAAVAEHDATLARRLIAEVRTTARSIPDVDVVGAEDDRLPHICTFSVLYADGEVLLEELDRRGIAVGSGSACTSDTLEPSHVLAAMGALTQGNVRVTLPLPAVTSDLTVDVDALCAALPDAIAAVRERLGTAGL